VDVDTGLELADHEVVLTVGLDVLDRESADPWVSLARKQLRLGISGLKIKRLFSVECENLGRGHNVALVENSQAGVLVRNIGGLLPGKLDGVADDVLDGEVADTEDGGENGTAESGTTGKSLVGIEGERESLAEESLDTLLESRDTRSATNDLDNINIVLGELSLSKSLLEGLVGSGKERLNHSLELLAGDHGGSINVVHERLNVNGGLLVGRQNLLGLLGGGDGTGEGTAVGHDVDFVLALEFLGKVINKGTVEVTTTKVLVPCGSLHGELTLLELNNGDSVAAVADIDKADAAGLLLRSGQVELCDAPAKSSGGAIIDKTENSESSNLGSVDESTALDVSEPGRHTHANILNGELELSTGGLLDLAQVHANKLSSSELLLLAQVVNLGANLTVDIDERSSNILLLNLNIGIVE
jgi:hypothetical protein